MLKIYWSSMRVHLTQSRDYKNHYGWRETRQKTQICTLVPMYRWFNLYWVISVGWCCWINIWKCPSKRKKQNWIIPMRNFQQGSPLPWKLNTTHQWIQVKSWIVRKWDISKRPFVFDTGNLNWTHRHPIGGVATIKSPRPAEEGEHRAIIPYLWEIESGK